MSRITLLCCLLNGYHRQRRRRRRQRRQQQQHPRRFSADGIRANDKYWGKWEKWLKGISEGGKYAKIDWTRDYRVRLFFQRTFGLVTC
jgi:hypothetical protein